ncbi:hypothetical protein H6P81_017545 [Aristolochia fimbriata]|uniref:Reverse transcriptase Ty1/copia-type domain-containing protein n=1 Tax=Aristolochia fimbriata TaxID=158543 RepID=A0AAV7E1K1_ARIFI|nr:hypothetical protein H6P81_017545 [Aristolochia fimbriata]
MGGCSSPQSSSTPTASFIAQSQTPSRGALFDLRQNLGQFLVTVNNITHHVSIKLDRDKLDRDNYLLWRQQFLPIFNSQSLMGFIDNSIKPPPKYSTTDSTTITSEYTQWYALDQTIQSWIVATLSNAAIGQTIGLTSASAMWLKLQRVYASTSQARLNHLWFTLQTLRKGTMPMSAYLENVKHIVDNLAAAGAPLDDQTVTHFVVNGLGPDFEPFAQTEHRPQLQAQLQNFDNSSRLSLNIAARGSRGGGRGGRGRASRGRGQTNHNGRGHDHSQTNRKPLRANFYSRDGIRMASTSLTTMHLLVVCCHQFLIFLSSIVATSFKITCPPLVFTTLCHVHTHLRRTGKLNANTITLWRWVLPCWRKPLCPNPIGTQRLQPQLSLSTGCPLPCYSPRVHLKCLCYPHLRSYSSHKLEDRSTTCVFLGYHSNYKGYRCFDVSKNRVYVSHNLVFDETVFPYSQPAPLPTPKISPPSFHTPPIKLLPIPPNPSLLPPEPTCYSQAVKFPEWRDAMHVEFNALLMNNSWSLVSLPRGSPKDWLQVGLSKLRPRQTTTLTNTRHGWLPRGSTKRKEVYMTQPPGFQDKSRPNVVCKLHKSLYGLKRSPRAWYHHLSLFLLELGFILSKADSSLLIRSTAHNVTFVLVYVDDIIVTGSSPLDIRELIQQLQKEFFVKDLGHLHYFLGIEVTRIPNGLHLAQTKYTRDLLTRLDLIELKPLSTSVVAGSKLSKYEGTPLDDPTTYRATVGALQYLTLTRPDIQYAVNQTSSKKQTTVSRSSAEAEYRALEIPAAELTWILQLFNELGVFMSQPPILWCDNLSTTYIAAKIQSFMAESSTPSLTITSSANESPPAFFRFVSSRLKIKSMMSSQKASPDHKMQNFSPNFEVSPQTPSLWGMLDILYHPMIRTELHKELHTKYRTMVQSAIHPDIHLPS